MGPLQYVLFGVRGPEQQEAVVRSLRSLSQRGAIRIIDVVYATKKDDGTLVRGRATSLTDDERKQFGTIAGALIGLGYGGEEGAQVGAELGAQRAETLFNEHMFGEAVFGESAQEIRAHLKEVAEDLPTGASCAIALIEHLWIPQLRDELAKQGVLVMGTGLIRPRTLVMLGATLHQMDEARVQA